ALLELESFKARPRATLRTRPELLLCEPISGAASSARFGGSRAAGEWRKPMARAQQDYDDIPGTFVFDAERSRQGYGINMFCMSLMKDANRKAFKANEAEYLKKVNLTPAHTDAILKRDYNRMLELGGNIYFTAKLGATDGHSFQHLAALMTGSSQQDYAAMMLSGGRSVEGNRSRSGKGKPAKSKSNKSKSKSKSSAKRK